MGQIEDYSGPISRIQVYLILLREQRPAGKWRLNALLNAYWMDRYAFGLEDLEELADQLQGEYERVIARGQRKTNDTP